MWIYQYIRADLEEIDMGPFASEKETDEARRKHASFGATVSETVTQVPDNYKLYKGE